MRKTLVAAAAAALLLLAGCGSDGDTTATDPAGSPSPSASPGAMPTEVPAAPGTVWTYNVATVMDTGSPELCLGPVAESYPPQCSGPPIDGWDWADHKGSYDSEQGTRWGMYAVGGTWDGTTFTVTDAVAAAVYDPMALPDPANPMPATHHTDAELADIAEEVGELPGALTFQPQDDHVLVDVVYDDGSLQAWADHEYGEGVVVVTSMLVDEES